MSLKAFTLPCVLSIAGSDSSGGAGLQADLKTIEALGLYGASVVTSLTAQNTMGVTAVLATPPDVVEAQVDAVFDDIAPAAVKIGMVGDGTVAHAVAVALRRHDAANVVLDPLMVATSGAVLATDDAVRALVAELFSLADVVTPNIAEAETLSGIPIVGSSNPHAAMERAAVAISQLTSGAVLVKGGHAVADADDVLRTSDGRLIWLRGERVDAPNTHGTGCTLSSAIACGLAGGLGVEAAVREAKAYLTGALCAGLSLGHGSGPLDHLWRLRPFLS